MKMKFSLFALLFLLCSAGYAQEPQQPNLILPRGNVDQVQFQVLSPRAAETAWKEAGGIKSADVKALKVHEPVRYGQLSLYLITGKPHAGKPGQLETLSESMEGKTGVVVETGNVNQLAVKNQSNKRGIYINSGDIVKGGNQDRTLAYDLWVPANVELPLASFCVEQGRWSQRGSEEVQAFSSSYNALSSRSLKIASVVKNTQGEVWNEVSKLQERLNAKLATDVKAEKSGSSLQLSLENEELQAEIGKYEEALAGFGDQRDAIGFAFAIDGELFGADYYADPALFAKMRKKLLHAAIVEAVSEDLAKKKAIPEPEEVEAVISFFNDIKKGAFNVHNPYNATVKLENQEGYQLESRINPEATNGTETDLGDFRAENWLHRSLIFKPADTE